MEKLLELTRAWHLLAVRALLALALAFFLPFATGLLKYPLLGAVSVPFIMASFAAYIMADSVTTFLFARQFPPHHEIRRVSSIQGATCLLIGLAMLTFCF